MRFLIFASILFGSSCNLFGAEEWISQQYSFESKYDVEKLTSVAETPESEQPQEGSYVFWVPVENIFSSRPPNTFIGGKEEFEKFKNAAASKVICIVGRYEFGGDSFKTYPFEEVVETMEVKFVNNKGDVTKITKSKGFHPLILHTLVATSDVLRQLFGEHAIGFGAWVGEPETPMNFSVMSKGVLEFNFPTKKAKLRNRFILPFKPISEDASNNQEHKSESTETKDQTVNVEKGKKYLEASINAFKQNDFLGCLELIEQGESLLGRELDLSNSDERVCLCLKGKAYYKIQELFMAHKSLKFLEKTLEEPQQEDFAVADRLGLQTLSLLLCQQGDWSEAKRALEKAETASEIIRSFQKKSVVTQDKFTHLQRLVLLNLKLREFKEAQANMADLELLAKNLAPNNQSLQVLYKQIYGMIAEVQGNLIQAEQIYSKWLNVCNSERGVLSLPSLGLLSRLYWVNDRLGKNEANQEIEQDIAQLVVTADLGSSYTGSLKEITDDSVSESLVDLDKNQADKELIGANLPGITLIVLMVICGFCISMLIDKSVLSNSLSASYGIWATNWIILGIIFSGFAYVDVSVSSSIPARSSNLSGVGGLIFSIISIWITCSSFRAQMARSSKPKRGPRFCGSATCLITAVMAAFLVPAAYPLLHALLPHPYRNSGYPSPFSGACFNLGFSVLTYVVLFTFVILPFCSFSKPPEVRSLNTEGEPETEGVEVTN